MKTELLNKSWDDLNKEVFFSRITMVVMAVTLALMAFLLSEEDTIVVLTPPEITERMEVASNKFDENTKRSWAMFSTVLLGNITPSNADFYLNYLEPIMTPKVWQSMHEAMGRQIEMIVSERLTLRFSPRGMIYEPPTDKVFVTGEAILSGPSGDEITETRTYEYVVDASNYSPVITRFDMYPDGPRTQKWLQQQEALKANEQG